jgi:ribosome-associated protein
VNKPDKTKKIKPAELMNSETLKKLIEAELDDAKAEEITVIDLAGKTDIADYMIVASGRSDRHVAAIADRVAEALKKAGCQDLSVEGKEKADWVLVDAIDVIVHLFRQEVREYYNLEKMWAAPMR